MVPASPGREEARSTASGFAFMILTIGAKLVVPR
jgi:hypothetical protein